MTAQGRLSMLGAGVYGALFAFLVFRLRFDLPRFDYWDVAYAGTKVAVSEPATLIAYLFHGNESMMAMPKLLILLTNTIGGGNALLIEHGLTLLLGVAAHILLLRILRLPLIPGAGNLVRWWLVLLLFWWPAVVATYTNTWYSIQYGFTLFFGLLAVYFYADGRCGPGRSALCYLAWAAAAATHGTGLLLGPVLAVLSIGRERRWAFGIALLAGTGAILWIQHVISRGVVHNVLRLESGASLDTFKFIARVITPPMWETALFVLIVVPLLGLTVWLYTARRHEYGRKPYTPLILWGLAVWISICVARSGFQTHANPHYLRFFVVLYAAWGMMLMDAWLTRAGRGWLGWAACALAAVVWVKGAQAGVAQAELYRDQIRAGTAVLRDGSGDPEALCHLYPDGDRLTRVLLPRLARTHSLFRGLEPPAAMPADCD